MLSTLNSFLILSFAMAIAKFVDSFQLCLHTSIACLRLRSLVNDSVDFVIKCQ